MIFSILGIYLVIFLTSCDSPPEKPFYAAPFKPKFISNAEKFKIINEKLSSTDSIIVKEGQHELGEFFKKNKDIFIQFLKIYKSKDSVNYALLANIVVKSQLQRFGPEGLKMGNQVAKLDKAKFVKLCRNAGIIADGYEMFFEDYNPYEKVAVEKQKGNRRKTAQ